MKRPQCERCKLGRHAHHEREKLGCTEIVARPPRDRVCGCVVGAVQPLTWTKARFNYVPDSAKAAEHSRAHGFVARKAKTKQGACA